MDGTADILGHKRVLARLWAAAAAESLHHAYLFEGPKGAGKATVAVRLAQAVNCTGPGSRRPCGRCATCEQIAAGTHPDVTVLSPASDSAAGTIKVDAVRELIRQTGYRRFNARRRMVIVDPAEAMMPSAANALLKTLEEPPDGTGFILIASNASALLPTIRSRCQRIRFGAVAPDALVPWLAQKGFSEHAAAAARLSQGCPGKALALAEGGLVQRNELRTALLTAMNGDLHTRFEWSSQLTQAKRRADWRPKVEATLDILEDLLRDAAVQGSGSDQALLNSDLPDIVKRWSEALWPQGVEVLNRAVADTRDQLALNVTGKLALDALSAVIVRELGPRQ